MDGTVMGVLLGALVRAAVLLVVTLAWVAVVDHSDSTDALGAGLIAFVLLVTISFGWSIVDAVRNGFVAALLRWLPAAAIGAVGITLFVADEQTWGDVVFFAILLLGPAVAGAGIGGVLRRAFRGPAQAVT
jgi:hypothetical protein